MLAIDTRCIPRPLGPSTNQRLVMKFDFNDPSTQRHGKGVSGFMALAL
jgi:hypothetical protein